MAGEASTRYNRKMLEERPLTYDHRSVERSWQERWEREGIYRTPDADPRPKYYVLEMLPYPSGDLHVGHAKNYTLGDSVARLMRMHGYNVLHPMGWDAFGLPAENAAIQRGIDPDSWTRSNIDNMRRQIKLMGTGYDWTREFATCDPEYYRWNQWFFLRMYERGLAYKRETPVNWCPVDQTVLANEQVEDGRCWRCDALVERRNLSQWNFKITAYADRLLADLERLDGWPERIRTMQRNWIGRSEGCTFAFDVEGVDARIDVFTTRVDTVYGVTFLAIAAEHPVVAKLLDAFLGERAEGRRVCGVADLEVRARTHPTHGEERRRDGSVCDSPALGGARSDLGDELRARRIRNGRGDGRPRARRTRLRFRAQARTADRPRDRAEQSLDCARDDNAALEAAFVDDGVLVNSGEFSGLSSADSAYGDYRAVRGTRTRDGDDQFPHSRLADFASALLGYADPDDLLSDRRDGPGPRRSASGRVAARRRVHRSRLAARQRPELHERQLPDVRRPRDARPGHDGHVRRLVLVLRALPRSARRGAAVRAEHRRLAAGRPVHRRRRARGDAFALRALLLQVHGRRGLHLRR